MIEPRGVLAEIGGIRGEVVVDVKGIGPGEVLAKAKVIGVGSFTDIHGLGAYWFRIKTGFLHWLRWRQKTLHALNKCEMNALEVINLT